MVHQGNVLSIRNVTYSSNLKSNHENLLFIRGCEGTKMNAPLSPQLRSWEVGEEASVGSGQSSV